MYLFWVGTTCFASLNFFSSDHLKALYPDHEWKIWRFSATPKGFWADVNNQRAFFEHVAEVRGFKNKDDWYTITRADIAKGQSERVTEGVYEERTRSRRGRREGERTNETVREKEEAESGVILSSHQREEAVFYPIMEIHLFWRYRPCTTIMNGCHGFLSKLRKIIGDESKIEGICFSGGRNGAVNTGRRERKERCDGLRSEQEMDGRSNTVSGNISNG
jgi:hypothetical protein